MAQVEPPGTPSDELGVFRDSTLSSNEKETVTDKLLGKDSKARTLAMDSSARKKETAKIEKMLLGKHREMQWP
jgi:hypothetical protein